MITPKSKGRAMFCRPRADISATAKAARRKRPRDVINRRPVCLCFLIAYIWFSLAGTRASSAPAPAKPFGNVLLVSDIHFDPLADPTIVQQLIASPVAQWETIFASSADTDYSHFPYDTNYPLLKSALCAMVAQAPFDFTIVSGDCLRHDFRSAFIDAGGTPDQFPMFATNAAVFVVGELQAAFGIPVYLALGNDDSTCGDYHQDPGGPRLPCSCRLRFDAIGGISDDALHKPRLWK